MHYCYESLKLKKIIGIHPASRLLFLSISLAIVPDYSIGRSPISCRGSLFKIYNVCFSNFKKIGLRVLVTLACFLNKTRTLLTLSFAIYCFISLGTPLGVYKEGKYI